MLFGQQKVKAVHILLRGYEGFWFRPLLIFVFDQNPESKLADLQDAIKMASSELHHRLDFMLSDLHNVIMDIDVLIHVTHTIKLMLKVPSTICSFLFVTISFR